MHPVWQIITYPFRRQPPRPLAERRPARDEMGQNRTVPLGMEATDLTMIDRVNRRNDALERVAGLQGRKGAFGSFLAGASTQVDPMPEDETYAARYHRAYIKKED